MLWLKSCPRCQGDLSAAADMWEPYVSCLQCGYYVTAAEQKALIGAAVPPEPASRGFIVLAEARSTMKNRTAAV